MGNGEGSRRYPYRWVSWDSVNTSSVAPLPKATHVSSIASLVIPRCSTRARRQNHHPSARTKPLPPTAGLQTATSPRVQVRCHQRSAREGRARAHTRAPGDSPCASRCSSTASRGPRHAVSGCSTHSASTSRGAAPRSTAQCASSASGIGCGVRCARSRVSRALNSACAHPRHRRSTSCASTRLQSCARGRDAQDVAHESGLRAGRSSGAHRMTAVS